MLGRMRRLGIGVGVGVSELLWTPASLPYSPKWFEALDDSAHLTAAVQPTVVDGDMEAVDTSAYVDLYNAPDLLAKVAGSPGGTGTQAMRLLASAGGIVDAAQSSAAIGSITGNREKHTIWVRGESAYDAQFNDQGGTPLYFPVTASWVQVSGDATFIGGWRDVQKPSAKAAEWLEIDNWTIENLTRTHWLASAGTGDLANATALQQPWISSTTINGYGALQFDGTADNLVDSGAASAHPYHKGGSIAFAFVPDASTATAQPMLVDGDMEAAGVADWQALRDAILTKETTTPHGGTNCLRIAYDGIDNPYARQDVFTDGAQYRIHGYARGDGTAAPMLYSGAILWTGTSSTDWQEFDVTFVAVDIQIRMHSNVTAAGYTEWDDVTIELAPYTLFDTCDGDASNVGITCEYDPVIGQVTLQVANGGGTFAYDLGSYTCPSAATHTVEAYWDGSTMTMSVDGGLASTQAITGALSAADATSTLYVGCKSGGTDYYAGLLPEWVVETAADMAGMAIAGAYLRTKYGVTQAATAFTPALIAALAAWYEAVDVDATLVKATQPTLVNGGCETGDTTGWTASNATLSAQSADPYEGSYYLRNVATAANGQATQDILISGNRYNAIGALRSVSGAATKFYIGLNPIISTVVSTWQAFDLDATCAGTTTISCYYATLGGTGEFDILSLTNLSRTRWNPTAGSLGGYLSQATAAAQPWWDGSGVRFDDALDSLNSSLTAAAWQFTQSATSSCSFYFVAKTDTAATYRGLFRTYTAYAPSNTGHALILNGGSAGKVGLFSCGLGVNTATESAGTPITAGTLQIIELHKTAGSFEVLVNGVSAFSCSPAVLSAADPNIAISIGASGSSGQSLNGTMPEWLVCDGILSASEKLATRTYLAAKHGITLP